MNDFYTQMKDLSKNVKGIYKTIIEDSSTDLYLVAFEIAQQANTCAASRSGVETAVGKEMVELCLSIFPNAKIGDSYKNPNHE